MQNCSNKMVKSKVVKLVGGWVDVIAVLDIA
jgi:hypothetical protein